MEGATFNFSGRSAYRPDHPPKPEPITLTTLLQKPGWGTLIGTILGALLVYGCSGIIYFTNLIITAPDPVIAGLYRFIIVENIVDGAVTFLVTWALFNWLTRQFRVIWQRHLVISLIITGCFFVVNTALYYLIGREVFEFSYRTGLIVSTGMPPGIFMYWATCWLAIYFCTCCSRGVS